MAFPNQITKLSELIQDIITGALIRTAKVGARWQITGSAQANEILGFTGSASETAPAQLTVNGDAIQMVAPTFAGSPLLGLAALSLLGGAGGLPTEAQLAADEIGVATTASEISMDLSGFAFGPNGTPILELRIFFYTGNTDGSGNLTVAHGLSGACVFAFCQGTNNGLLLQKQIVTSVGATVVVRAVNTTTGASSPGVAISGFMLVVR